jgi:hypothetical protein
VDLFISGNIDGWDFQTEISGKWVCRKIGHFKLDLSSYALMILMATVVYQFQNTNPKHSNLANLQQISILMLVKSHLSYQKEPVGHTDQKNPKNVSAPPCGGSNNNHVASLTSHWLLLLKILQPDVGPSRHLLGIRWSWGALLTKIIYFNGLV